MSCSAWYSYNAHLNSDLAYLNVYCSIYHDTACMCILISLVHSPFIAWPIRISTGICYVATDDN